MAKGLGRFVIWCNQLKATERGCFIDLHGEIWVSESLFIEVNVPRGSGVKGGKSVLAVKTRVEFIENSV